MKKILKTSVLVSTVLIFTVGSFAQPFQRMRRERPPMHNMPSRLLFALKAHQEELKITGDQLEQIEKLVFSFEEKMIAAHSEIDLNELEIRKLMKDRENIDYAKIRATLGKVSNQRDDMFVARLKHQDEIISVLTSEQGEALKSLIRDRLDERRSFLRERGFPGDRRSPRFPRFPESDEEK
ncbi:MAG: Spy/CpxP family protein refolding chaperone [Candidatus Aminicenantes bacterium]|nr:Spy/CpxP family protein refolding chaperone [Candidatus Aminicenantes bacterium]